MCVFIPNCNLLKNDSDVETYSSIASNPFDHTGKCIRRFGGIYAYCRYLIDRKL